MITLKLTKKLTKKESRHIEEILEKRKFLSKLDDKSVFSEDYNSRDMAKAPPSPELRKILDKEVGPCIIPAHQLSRFDHLMIMLHEKTKRYKKVKFSITLEQYPENPKHDSIFLGVEKKRLPSNFIYNCYLNLDQGLPTIFTTALSFYNKRDIYNRVRKILLKNEENLKSKMGNLLTEDIIKLFSIRKTINVNNNINNNINKEEICETKNEDRKLKEFKGIQNFTIRYKFDKSYADVSMLIFMTDSNDLCIYNMLSTSKDTAEPIKWTKDGIPEFMNTEKYKKFAIKWAKNCIDNLDSMTSFGMEIYKKFETNILITI